MGIQPDVIVCRSEHPLTQDLKDKIALFCNVPCSHVLQTWMWNISMKRPWLWRGKIWRKWCLSACICLPGPGSGGVEVYGG